MLKYLLFSLLLQGNGNQPPDGYFYYALSLLLASTLIFIVWHFANQLTKTLNALKITVAELVVMTKVHDKDIEDLKKRKK